MSSPNSRVSSIHAAGGDKDVSNEEVDDVELSGDEDSSDGSSSDKDEDEDDPGLSVYENLRERNIKKNLNKLDDLGFLTNGQTSLTNLPTSTIATASSRPPQRKQEDSGANPEENAA